MRRGSFQRSQLQQRKMKYNENCTIKYRYTKHDDDTSRKSNELFNSVKDN